MKRLSAIIVGFSALLPAVMLQADDIALQSFANGSPLGGAGATAGWEFMANDNITVTELGFWQPGLSSTSVPIGLWTDSGTFLAQATVTTGSSLVDGFLYTPLSSGVALTAGQDYLIGALFESDTAMSGTTNVVTAPQVTFLEDAFIYTGVLSAPTLTASSEGAKDTPQLAAGRNLQGKGKGV